MTHCPHCGAPVPPRAPACPDCGSDADTGWASEEDLDEAAWSAFDDDDYADVIRGLPGAEPERPDLRRIVLAIVALVTLLAFVVAFVV